MSKYGNYLNTAKALVGSVNPAYSSVTEWVDILTSERYSEDSYDAIDELLEAIRVQGFDGIAESSRAIRKKLKYGNTHRQIRALTILLALSENGWRGYKNNFANEQLLERLQVMTTDPLTDPKVKRKLLATFHAWSIAFADDPQNRPIANLFKEMTDKRRPSQAAASRPDRSSYSTFTRPSEPQQQKQQAQQSRGGFEDLDHSWTPSRGAKDYSTGYEDLAAIKQDTERRRAEREARAALEARETEVERRERALAVKQEEKAKSEAYRRELAEAEARKRANKEKERMDKQRSRDTTKSGRGNNAGKKRAPFDLAKEKPKILIAIANASQASITLVNACRHVNLAEESMLENLKVQDALEEAKVIRRPIIRYIQLVEDENLVAVLLDANEKILEAVHLYDKMCKAAAGDHDNNDSADEDDEDMRKARAESQRDADALAKKLESQKIGSQHTGEVWKMQQQQKYESDRRSLQTRGGHALERGDSSRLPPPMTPDELGSESRGYLSDYSDYDSSDEEYQSRAYAARHANNQASAGSSSRPTYESLQDFELDSEFGGGNHTSGGPALDPNDPFADPTDFLDSLGSGGGSRGKERQEWAAI